MVDQSKYIGFLVLWLACLAFILFRQRQHGSGAGLVIAYVLQMWLLHWLAAGLYALPWYISAPMFSWLGLEQATIAICGFAVGCAILVPFLLRHRPAIVPDEARPSDPLLVRLFIVSGAWGFFILDPLFSSTPTLSALASAASNLLLVGLIIVSWNAFHRPGALRRSWRWVLPIAAMPFITIVTKGFLGYGFAAMCTILAFVSSFYRPRWKLAVCSVFVGYLALSLYVTYMRDRQDIRQVVWGQESYVTRLSAVGKMFAEFEFFDIRNLDHLNRIDDRLNQNLLVGMAVFHLEDHPERFANGRTIWEAFLSPIPRIIWRDKPMMAGSGEMVADFTGEKFGEGTSVGIGHVMEWYVNFGSFGVFFGMLFIGVAVGWLDRRAGECAYRGDWRRLALWWLPGLSLLQVGGSLVEAVSGACAALVVAKLVFLLHRDRPEYRPRDRRPIRSKRGDLHVSVTAQ